MKKMMGLVVMVVLGLLAGGAQATPLSLDYETHPDLAVAFVASSYNAGTKLFVAHGWPQSYVDPAGGTPDFFGLGDDFNLTANINADAVAHLNSGSFTLSGSSDGSNLDRTLTGDLLDFGYAFHSGTEFDFFEFKFKVTGGTLAADYGGVNSLGGIKLYDVTPLNEGASFGSGWSDTVQFDGQDGSADVLKLNAIPEPSAFVLVGLSLLGLCVAARHHGRKNAAEILTIDYCGLLPEGDPAASNTTQ